MTNDDEVEELAKELFDYWDKGRLGYLDSCKKIAKDLLYKGYRKQPNGLVPLDEHHIEQILNDFYTQMRACENRIEEKKLLNYIEII